MKFISASRAVFDPNNVCRRGKLESLFAYELKTNDFLAQLKQVKLCVPRNTENDILLVLSQQSFSSKQNVKVMLLLRVTNVNKQTLQLSVLIVF